MSTACGSMPLVGDQTAALTDLEVGLRMDLGTPTAAEIYRDETPSGKKFR